jgi:hypothetical protein
LLPAGVKHEFLHAATGSRLIDLPKFSSLLQGGPQREAPLDSEASDVVMLPRARTASRGLPTSDGPPTPGRAKPHQPTTTEEPLH